MSKVGVNVHDQKEEKNTKITEGTAKNRFLKSSIKKN